MITIKVGRRGQITLPSEVRRKLGLRQGNYIVVISQGDQVILRPISKTLLDLYGGVLISELQNLSAIRKQVISNHAEKSARDGN